MKCQNSGEEFNALKGKSEYLNRIRVEKKVQKSFTGGVMVHIFLEEVPIRRR